MRASPLRPDREQRPPSTDAPDAQLVYSPSLSSPPSFAAWFASLPHQYKLLTAGNHDVFSVAGELDELRGAAAPAAGARPRAYIRARGEFALYLQNEGCVIPMPGGGEVSIHARTFHTGSARTHPCSCLRVTRVSDYRPFFSWGVLSV